MKKIKYFVVAMMLFSMTIEVSALENTSKYTAVKKEELLMSDGITESVEINVDSKYYITEVNAKIIIPEDYDKKDINISSKVFEELGKNCNVEYYCSMPGDSFNINFEIVNNSKYDYYYVDSSVDLATKNFPDSFEKLGDIKGFNGMNIYYKYSETKSLVGYRTLNKPLKALMGTKVKTSDLTDEKVGESLKSNGYTGIEELNKYYLDYYNKLLNESYAKLEDLPIKYIAEVFNGNRSMIEETNQEVIQLNYNFFYNELLAVTFDGAEYNDSLTGNYSIGSYMRDGKELNEVFLNSFAQIGTGKTKELNNMTIHINGPYTVNAYMDYAYDMYLGFKLERVITESEDKKDEESKKEDTGKLTEKVDEKVDEDIIIPPHTGI